MLEYSTRRYLDKRTLGQLRTRMDALPMSNVDLHKTHKKHQKRPSGREPASGSECKLAPADRIAGSRSRASSN